jgi:stage II sporulation protein D
MTNLKISTLFILSAVLLFPCSLPAAGGDLSSALTQGKFDEAIAGYRSAAENGNLSASLDLAVALKDLGNYEEALFILRRAEGRFGPKPELLSLLARLYYLDAKNEPALKVLTELLALKPDDIEANTLAGLCYEALGKGEQARHYYEKVVSLDKDNITARLSLAQLYCRQNRLEESEANFRKVSLLDASIGKVYGCWADVLYKMGNYREAFRIYEKLKLIDPADASVKERLELVRRKLGDEFFKGEHERVAESRKGKTVLVKPAAVAKNMQQVSVGLLTGVAGTIKFKSPVPFAIEGKNGGTLTGRPNSLYEIGSGQGRVSITDENGVLILSASSFLIRPVAPEGCLMFFALKTGASNFWAELQDRSFRGTVEVRAVETGRPGFDLINRLSLEEYLYSVVPSEMPASWPIEALKAQAVAARSEAIRKLGRHKSEGFDFCAEVHCQAYYGVEKESEASRLAVDDTAGVIMSYNGKPVDAIYSSTCGGHTQDNIFGGSEPYLKGRADFEGRTDLSFPLSPYMLEQWLRNPPKGILCDIPEYLNPSSFRWVRIYTADELRGLVDKTQRAGDIRKILITRRNKSGHVDELRIRGSQSSLVLEKELVIRKALGDLRSGLFKVEIKYGADRKPEQFIFYGGGWGHAVGLCQAGACGLALKGHGYTDILRRYYDGITFDKLY